MFSQRRRSTFAVDYAGAGIKQSPTAVGHALSVGRPFSMPAVPFNKAAVFTNPATPSDSSDAFEAITYQISFGVTTAVLGASGFYAVTATSPYATDRAALLVDEQTGAWSFTPAHTASAVFVIELAGVDADGTTAIVAQWHFAVEDVEFKAVRNVIAPFEVEVRST